MANFYGTDLSETIEPGFVSASVFSDPAGSTPSLVDDFIEGFGGDDWLDGGGGNDTIYTGAGDDVAFGGDGDDYIDDLPDSGGGNDYLDGGTGNDIVYGYLGNDTIYGGTGSDELFGEDDNDYMSGDDGDDSLDGGFGNDTMLGGLGNDILIGGAGQDTMQGGDGVDTVRGGNGNDVISGGLKADTLIGGLANDRFDFDTPSGSTPAQRDSIVAGDGAIAFQGAGGPNGNGDRIDVSDIDANVTAGGNQTFLWGGNGKGHLSLINVGTDTIVHANTDNDAAFEFELRIVDGGVTAGQYNTGDFLL